MTTTQVRDSLAQQRAMYGAPIGEIAASITSALGLTQGKLAEVLGLSAPMLSQLASGHRVKIGNPAVVHRLQALLTLVGDAPDLTEDQVRARLVEIRAEQATLTAGSSASGSRPAGDARHTAVAVLRASARAADLEVAAAATTAPDLASLLREAAAGAARG